MLYTGAFAAKPSPHMDRPYAGVWQWQQPVAVGMVRRLGRAMEHLGIGGASPLNDTVFATAVAVGGLATARSGAAATAVSRFAFVDLAPLGQLCLGLARRADGACSTQHFERRAALEWARRVASPRFAL